MAASNNPYKDLQIDRSLMQESVQNVGMENYKYVQIGTLFHMSFIYKKSPYCISVYENKNGTTTLSAQMKTPEYLEVFSMVAETIKAACAAGTGGRCEVVIPKFEAANWVALLGYLTEQSSAVESDKVENGYRIVRLKGQQGDVLTLKYYDNKTLQLQGRSAMLAAMGLDFLASVLSYEDAVTVQLTTFSVPIKLKDIRLEVEGRLPMSFARVSGVVQAQLTTALALSKLDIDLPDYTPVAFPALKGLEGFLKSELNASNFQSHLIGSFGEYFEQGSGHDYKMKSLHAKHAGEPAATLFGKCYTILHDERHSLAHLGTGEHNTRILPNLSAAQAIVSKVLNSIEDFCVRLPR